ncbi:MAG: shikimate kinase [Roseimicrobium sp.]
MNPSANNGSPPQERAANIVLVGLMGSGKSTVGRLTAQSLGFSFVDTDQLIVEEAGLSIPDIFAKDGESGFRARETFALRSLLGHQGLVVATGGGIVTQTENRLLLRQLGFVVWLNADPLTLHQRTAHSHDRPLLRNDDPAGTLRMLYEVRRDLYQQVCDMKVTTDEFSPQDVAYGIAETARVEFGKRRQ